jgi:DNA-directed RNA polymerase subunit H (RpoH/RPB5)
LMKTCVQYRACELLLVSSVGMSPAALKCVYWAATRTEVRGDHVPSRVQHFSIDELQCNTLTHERVPQHVVQTPAEVEQVLRAHHLPPGSATLTFPKLLTTDLVVRLQGLCVGDVVRIRRRGALSNAATMYRVVVWPDDEVMPSAQA